MKIPNYGTVEGLIFVALFAIAMGGFLWAANKPVKTTPKNIAFTLGFVALALFDAAVLIINKP